MFELPEISILSHQINLTQDKLLPGLDNSIAQDILLSAQLHPKELIRDLDEEQRQTLYTAIVGTVQKVIAKGGRYDEFNLFGKRDGYVRLMDKNTAGKPCPICSTTVEKRSYLGGTRYFCKKCQQLTQHT